ncbi:MAG TPA: Hsp20/alpha crystallin family protein [Fibrobacteria bacterium]|nr:Hsp20/alpha crystallin family protein [Fibrobacteria bacterium]
MALSDWTFTPGSGFEREFERLRRQMDDVFGRIGLGSGAGFPAVNIYDQGEEMLVAVHAPGVKKEDLSVELRENTLTVSGTRKAPDHADAQVLREESAYGGFKRSVRIPTRVQHDKIEASLKNGILLVKMPKSEDAKPKHIAINA